MPTDLIKLRDFKDEILNFVRFKLNSLDDKSRTTEVTEEFNGDGNETEFTPSESATLRYVKLVTVGGVTQTFGTDYTFTFPGPDRTGTPGKIIFTVAPEIGTDNVDITYGHGKTWIYTDHPRIDLGVEQYPRMAISVTVTSVPGGMGGGLQSVTDSTVMVDFLYMSQKTFTLDSIQEKLREEIVSNVKRFFHFKWIQPELTREITITEDRTADVMGRNSSFLITHRKEIITYEV